MREIKFRAWHDDSETCGEFEPQKNMFFVGDEYGTTHPLDCVTYKMEGQPVTLMQFTGLTDVNGVEIYHEDILTFDWLLQSDDTPYASDCLGIIGSVELVGCRFVVSFFGGSMSFGLDEINQATFGRFWREDYASAPSEYFKMTGFKIIGNKYQNPELLEQA